MHFVRTSLPHILVLALLLLHRTAGAALGQPPISAEESSTAAESITLDRIMSDPEWLGRSPEGGYWSDDGKSVYYQRPRAGSKQRDLFQSDLSGNLLRVVADADRGTVDSAEGEVSRDGQLKVYEREGDLFLKNLSTGIVRQLTRTRQRESSPRFMSDGKRLMFTRDGVVLARHLKDGQEVQLVDIRMEKDPEENLNKDREGFLPEQQERLFEIVQKERKEAEEARQRDREEEAADRTRATRPFYLGDSHRLQDLQVSTNGRWCLVILSSKNSTEGTPDKMPEYVDESGYVQVRNVRSLVGTERPASDQLLLLDLVKHTQIELKLNELPDIYSDPLEEIRTAGKEWRKKHGPNRPTDDASPNAEALNNSTDAESSKAPQASNEASNQDEVKEETHVETQEETTEVKAIQRTIQATSVSWNDVGDLATVQFFSDDNKDRWLTAVHPKEKKLTVLMHRRDPAWINGRVARVGWMKDSQSVYYLSEDTGYAHLYISHVPSQATRQLTQGNFVVSDVRQGLAGKYLYYQANAQNPGIYEVYRVDVSNGAIEQLTALGGANDFVVAPDESHLLVTHSTALSPPELWIQTLSTERSAQQITQTVSAEFQELPWIPPQFVKIPSRSGSPIHARLYLPPEHAEGVVRPAVIFIHGAGYLQNAHQGWSLYFREFMFHSLLAHRGFVVLDMDYQGSAGYGRDWRTAIYRNMGGPEVEDLLDGRAWLGLNHQVDTDRVGLYGGSYGGFLTMMALFKNPGVFACGAALRPVTDWAHYNHGYTSNILNTPEVDPEAYFRSSPIELAAGLSDPLLICHGMIDDNVFFKDTARLVQRLIELKKKDWEVAMYPVESHGFEQPSSWYDEYRRILELFESELHPASP
jgi:dipeptidyl aminopeptidase/acylaminoacyl peptidase